MDDEKVILFIREMNGRTGAGGLKWIYSKMDEECDTYWAVIKEGTIILQKNNRCTHQITPISLWVKPKGGQYAPIDSAVSRTYIGQYNACLQMLWRIVQRKAKDGPEDFIKSFLEDREDDSNTKEEIKQLPETKSECQSRTMQYAEEEMIKTILAAAFEAFKTLGDRTNKED